MAKISSGSVALRFIRQRKCWLLSASDLFSGAFGMVRFSTDSSRSA